MGIGGSVLFSTARGESSQSRRRSNKYFTAVCIGAAGPGSVFVRFLTCSQLLFKLRFMRPAGLPGKLKAISVIGFSVFFIDVAMGILAVLFNSRILRYLGTALSVYAIIIHISTFVQCCVYSIGQAFQPILSVNFDVGRKGGSGSCCNTPSAQPLPLAALDGGEPGVSQRPCLRVRIGRLGRIRGTLAIRRSSAIIKNNSK